MSDATYLLLWLRLPAILLLKVMMLMLVLSQASEWLIEA